MRIQHRTMGRVMSPHIITLPSAPAQERLTPREQDVASRVAEGMEMKEIARELGVGYHTVKMHILRAKRKLGARNQIELALIMSGVTPRSLRRAS